MKPSFFFSCFVSAWALLLALGAKAEPAEPAEKSEPAIQRITVEDDNARVDELRVRGETQRISVQTKGRFKSSYEIIPATGGRDLSSRNDRGSAGQRVWSVLSF